VIDNRPSWQRFWPETLVIAMVVAVLVNLFVWIASEARTAPSAAEPAISKAARPAGPGDEFASPPPSGDRFYDVAALTTKLADAKPEVQRLVAANPWVMQRDWADAIRAWYAAARDYGFAHQIALDIALGTVTQTHAEGKLCLPEQLSQQKRAEALRGRDQDEFAMGMKCRAH